MPNMQYPTANQTMRQYPPLTGNQTGMDMTEINTTEMYPVLRVNPQEGLTGSRMSGSMQEALADNLGLYAVCEFVVGTQEMETKAGILYSVGRSFLVLYDEQQQNFILCDIFSIKFVTMYMPGHRPWNVTRTPPVPMVEIPGVGIVPAGPYGIGTGTAPHLQNTLIRQSSMMMNGGMPQMMS